jgi:iron complex outermembrane receptor protein
MFRRSNMSLAVAATIAGLAAAVSGSVQAQTEQRVEITGSAIRRTDAETAVPITVLKMEELRAQGVTTVEQILSRISGMQTTQTTSQTVGAGTGGASFVDMRGIGPNKTLVLLNGRRIANNALDSSAPDINMIPIAALERVEVLRDGASSLYGTDAIGGVINFITRKDYTGGTVTLGYDDPEHPGGIAKSANIGFGFGDLETKGFNILGFADFQHQNPVKGIDRPFNQRYPGGISKSTFPANWYQGDGSVIGNPDAPACATGVFLIPGGDGTSCSMTTSKYVDYVPETDRKSGYLKGELRLNANNTLTGEYFITRSEVKTQIAPVPYGFFAQNPTRPDGTPNPYFPTNRFTPNIPYNPAYTGVEQGFGGPLTGANSLCGPAGCTLADLGLSASPGAPLQQGFVFGNWRAVPNGPRGDNNVNENQRLVLSLSGNAGKWDYDAGVAYSKTKTDVHLISGYGSGDRIYEGLLTGIINPFGAQDPAGAAYLDASLLPGIVQYGRGKTVQADARATNSQLGDWFSTGRQAGIAFGLEYRTEDFLNSATPGYTFQVAASTGIDPALHSEGDRKIYAGYVEFSLPLHKTLDMTLAARYDHYSDFGSSTNPKVSVRWQPVREVVVRSAYSTGFRAPSLYELYAGQAYTNTGNIADPAHCANPATGTNGAPDFCNDQFVALTGGNPELKPEKSKTFTLGLVVEPTSGITFGADYFNIRLTNIISFLSEEVLLNPSNYQGWAAAYIHRNPNNNLSDVTQVCPGPACGYLDQRNQNLGGTNTDGIDFTFGARKNTSWGQFNLTYNGTWVHKYEYQDYQTGPWNQNVGVYVGIGPVFRWQHEAQVTWKSGPFSAGLTGHYKSGYLDSTTSAQQGHPGWHVSNYATGDVYAGWTPVKGVDLLFGIRNFTDRDPPLSYQTRVFQAGYDPRFTDPTGRTYYVRGGYTF